MSKIDFLSVLDVYSINQTNLEIFQKMSPVAEFTDYAYYSINNPYLFRDGRWWLKTGDGKGNVDVVCGNGKCFSFEPDNSCVGTRPVINYSSIKNNITNINRNKFGILEGEYGEYIQKLITNEEKEALGLEDAYLHQQCSFTGKTYHVVMPCNYLLQYEFKMKEVSEYMISNRKFVRIEDSFNVSWFEVLPIKWLIDPQKDIMLSKNIILGRYPIYLQEKYYSEGSFEDTDIYQYLNDIFIEKIKDIGPKIKQKVLSNYKKY